MLDQIEHSGVFGNAFSQFPIMKATNDYTLASSSIQRSRDKQGNREHNEYSEKVEILP
jgi:hypothetical protein